MTRKTALLAALPLLATVIACGGKLDELIKPVLVTHPSSQSVASGSAFGFAVLATGANLSYQWFKLDTTTSTFVAVTGANSPTYSKTVASAGDLGTYRAEVTNAGGTVTSSSAILTFSPLITSQPSNQTVPSGSAFTFTVGASGASLTYQWKKLNTSTSAYDPISGATSASFTKASSSAGDLGTYRVDVTNAAGTTISSDATLTFTP